MQETTKSIFPKGEKNPYGEFFIRQSYLAALAKSPDGNVSVGNVTFEAGCRNNWHVHLDGYQILLVTEGSGWYQEENKKAVSLEPGNVIVTDKGVKHWHGAKKILNLHILRLQLVRVSFMKLLVLKNIQD